MYDADLIVISGQNPGTNHPRMLTALEKAKKNGAKILAINPLPEAGLLRFRNPQTPRGLSGIGTQLADLHLPIRINGDLALWQAFGAHAARGRGGGGRRRQRAGPRLHRTAHQRLRGVAAGDQEPRLGPSGRGDRPDPAADPGGRQRCSLASKGTVHCWAMGITQHRNAVATIKEFVNVSLLQGGIGRPGAGLFPVRGHSNVQGDRTMGIWEKVPDHFLDKLEEEYGIEPPREHGLDTVDSIRALRDGKARFFMGMGGNFVSAAPDTIVTEEAMEQAEMTVMVSTKLNRSHVRCGRTALILPALGRSERDLTGGTDQRVTVEDSLCSVHASRGPLKPASKELRSEVDIVCRMAEATLGTDGPIPWSEYRSDYATIRRAISHVVPGCASYDEKVEPARWVRAAPPAPGQPRVPDRDRQGDLHRQPDGRAPACPRGGCSCRGCAATTSSTPRSTASTTATAASRTAVGWSSCTPTTSAPRGSPTATSSTWSASGRTAPSGSVPSFRIVAYDTPRGCAAAYYPEVNPLVPLDSTATGQQLPDLEVGGHPAAAGVASGEAHVDRQGCARSARTAATSPTCSPST